VYGALRSYLIQTRKGIDEPDRKPSPHRLVTERPAVHYAVLDVNLAQGCLDAVTGVDILCS
jgi:hypothetical protein